MKENLINLLAEEKILPILRCKDAQLMIDRAKALIDAGIKVIEINVENPTIYKAIEEISKYANVCAGGIITSLQAEAAILSGAKILSSPIFSMNLVKISKDKQIPYIAGTSTANEAYNAWKARIPLIKIYPITAMGGAMYIEDLLRPMPFLNVMPLGNVKVDEIQSYINAGASVVGIGRDLYDGLSLSEITNRAKKVIKELKG
ncbi:2-dehydro-3-deoxyphosphogluconate aldolase/4-hydroxy-2-oxoglutarate aldolase [Clostridium sp. CAG:768]|nr:2-dehydro-3-deoxyphosphogluconate aldolase/4-hydroxy-2-oxoglutarate aldolase [Clostridium sp. CAG:768]